MAAKEKKFTVGSYLTKRLEQVGIKHIFGVPGDYVLGFFDCLEKSKVKMVCTCNELNAGYAADAYSRINGIGAACVTYGVGGFSILNAIAGAAAERLPLVIISGAPQLSEKGTQHLLHHTSGDIDLQYRIYEKVALAAVKLKSAEQAPQQIDETLDTCLRFKRPVYIEIPSDIVSKPCRKPGPLHIDTEIISEKDSLKEALEEAAEMLTKAKKPIIMAGIECHRLDLRKQLQKIVNHTGYHFTTTLLGKAVLPEKHPAFIGVYAGKVCRHQVRQAVEQADVILSLGALMTDINMGAWTAHLDPGKMIVANSDKVKIKHHVYDHVSLKDFINGLNKKLPKKTLSRWETPHPSLILEKKYVPQPEKAITLKRFYQRINGCFDKHNIVIAGTGDSILNAIDLYMPENVEFIGQAFYLSIGFSVPATLGAKLARPDIRPILFVGDGAFQMTAQEVSTMIRHKLNPVIFIMNNDGYTVERYLHDGPFNDLHMWQYHKIPELFQGGWGMQVRTEGELEQAIEKCYATQNQLGFIEVMLDKMDCSETLKNLAGPLMKKK